MRTISKLRLYVCLLLLCALVGCQQRAASKLQGRWEGRPDSAARRAQRDAEKYGDDPKSTAPAASDEESTPEQVTDWESYDVTISMDFVSADRLEMSLDGGQPVVGQWSIIATSPSGCTIEVETKTDGGADATKVQRRRFDLLLDEREGVCVGFQLTEAGADAQLGALYFQRSAAAFTSKAN